MDEVLSGYTAPVVVNIFGNDLSFPMEANGARARRA
jgi:hypothetical protein